MYTPVLVAELKIDMAFFPSGTGVEWPGVVTSLVPNPSSDCVINSVKQNTWTATQSVGYEGEQKELARRMEPVMSSVRNHGLCNQRESKACPCSALQNQEPSLLSDPQGDLSDSVVLAAFDHRPGVLSSVVLSNCTNVKWQSKLLDMHRSCALSPRLYRPL